MKKRFEIIFPITFILNYHIKLGLTELRILRLQYHLLLTFPENSPNVIFNK